jgi:glucosamine--fructose-6-phosphate aminotransferase (isomerizing)
MCGIVAYVGHRNAQPLLLDTLGRLEYRGYDSAGLALLNGSGLEIRKKAGRIAELSKLCAAQPIKGTIGISHTRWATHGEANDRNAHPHTDRSGKLAVVHNGVIENYLELKENLLKNGHTFSSMTDTEVLAHLIGRHYEQSRETGDDRLVLAVQSALSEVKGTFGLAIIHQDHPGLLVGARRGSPLVLGLGEKENFLSSDAAALIGYTQKVIYLKDHDVVRITDHDFSITTEKGESGHFEIHEISQSAQCVERGAFAHYMLKEIFEQPASIENAFRGRLDKNESSAKLGGLNLDTRTLLEIERIMVIACGTAMHAGMVGERIIESLAGIPVEVDHASEFRYRNSPVGKNTVFFAVSQSGETADTLGALREARRKGFRGLGICNNVSSSIARESDGGVYMHAGPEIGVAATKSFTSQLIVFALLGLLLGRLRSLSAAQGKAMIEEIEKLPAHVRTILAANDEIARIARKYSTVRSMLFLGRQFNYPIALEGALKMKEITYIHAEGYPSAELKHGVIALIDESTPTVFIMPNDSLYDKNMSSLQEVKARKGPVLAVITEDDTQTARTADDVIRVPRTLDVLQPVLNSIPLQLLSYHTAVALGRDVDKPRNLAKSVTVE